MTMGRCNGWKGKRLLPARTRKIYRGQPLVQVHADDFGLSSPFLALTSRSDKTASPCDSEAIDELAFVAVLDGTRSGKVNLARQTSYNMLGLAQNGSIGSAL